MAIGDTIEMLNTAMYGDEIQVYCTWEETGVRPDGIRPTFGLVGLRVVNDTVDPVALDLIAPDGTVYAYQVGTGETPFTLTDEQRTRFAAGVSIGVTGTPLPTS